jgi:tetratricopeptide (TPR) repeat protein
VDGDRVTWTASNALAAFVSIAVAASHLRGEDNFDVVSRGYAAYKDGRYEEAVTEYRRALAVNPYDMATRCRVGIVYQKMGRQEEALRWLREALADEGEIGEPVMRSACWLGVAQAELAVGHEAAARAAAERVLGLPDAFDRHQAARNILTGLPVPPERRP